MELRSFWFNWTINESAFPQPNTRAREKTKGKTIFQAARGAVREQQEGSFPAGDTPPRVTKSNSLPWVTLVLLSPPEFLPTQMQMGLLRGFLLDPPVLQGPLHRRVLGTCVATLSGPATHPSPHELYITLSLDGTKLVRPKPVTCYNSLTLVLWPLC